MTYREEAVQQGLAELVEEIVGAPAEKVTREASFLDDLDADSLSMVEVMVGVEEKFGVSVPDKEAKNLRTVGDAIDYIIAHS